MAAVMTEEQFRCSICLDIFNNPSSIPCGHNFCLECIKRFWDTKKNNYECPLCKEVFRPRPELRINIDLKNITDKFKGSVRVKRSTGEPARRRVPRQSSKSSDLTCDICMENKLKAVSSCLTCCLSFCENHLLPHQTEPALAQHWRTDPTAFASTHFCRSHNKFLELFCQREQTPVCVRCIEKEHKHHEIVPIEKEGKRMKSQMRKTEAEFQQMIQTRMEKCEEIKQSLKISKMMKERGLQTSVQVVTMVISAIENNQAQLTEEMEHKQDTAQRNGEELLRQLGQEIEELQGRCAKLHHLETTNNAVYILQSLPLLKAQLPTRDWSGVRVHTDHHIGTVRRSFSKLVEVCQELEKKLLAEEVSKTNQYAVDVTLDSATASSWLILSADGKQVSVSSQPRRTALPDDPRRFDSCVSVLGKESFTSGRHYWVVQVGDKTDWDLGVARESINRKGAIMVRPDSGYWAICRRKGGSLSACAGPSVALHLPETPQKVGVFLDYEDGVVSFYDAEAKTHIYTYSGCTFTEALYPYLNPCLHDNGKNTAPLIVCPLVEEPFASTTAF